MLERQNQLLFHNLLRSHKATRQQVLMHKTLIVETITMLLVVEREEVVAIPEDPHKDKVSAADLVIPVTKEAQLEVVKVAVLVWAHLVVVKAVRKVEVLAELVIMHLAKVLSVQEQELAERVLLVQQGKVLVVIEADFLRVQEEQLHQVAVLL